MGATTLVMLLGVLPAAWVPGLLLLFGGAVAGCAIRGVRQVAGRPRYLRLGVLCTAMLPMLVPTSASGATAAAAPQVMASAGGPHQMTSAAADTAVPAATTGWMLAAML